MGTLPASVLFLRGRGRRVLFLLLQQTSEAPGRRREKDKNDLAHLLLLAEDRCVSAQRTRTRTTAPGQHRLRHRGILVKHALFSPLLQRRGTLLWLALHGCRLLRRLRAVRLTLVATCTVPRHRRRSA